MFRINLENLTCENINNLINQRVSTTSIDPELVNSENVSNLTDYQRFADIEKKEKFRKELFNGLRAKWTSLLGDENASTIEAQFKILLKSFEEMGALIFGEILTKSAFEELINNYDQLLKEEGCFLYIFQISICFFVITFFFNQVFIVGYINIYT